MPGCPPTRSTSFAAISGTLEGTTSDALSLESCSSHSWIIQSLTADDIVAAVSGLCRLSMAYEQLRMPTSTFQASSPCPRPGPGPGLGGPLSGRVPGKDVVGAPPGYAVSVGPLNAEVPRYSRQWALRYGNSAWADGTLQWMSTSMTGWPRSIPRAASAVVLCSIQVCSLA